MSPFSGIFLKNRFLFGTKTGRPPPSWPSDAAVPPSSRSRLPPAGMSLDKEFSAFGIEWKAHVYPSGHDDYEDFARGWCVHWAALDCPARLWLRLIGSGRRDMVI